MTNSNGGDRLGLHYEIYEVSLPDRLAAFEWIVSNQQDRRNLSPRWQSYLRGEHYERIKAGHGGDRKSNDEESRGQIDPLKTDKKLGDTYGVAEKTIKRDAQFNRSVDTLSDSVGNGTKKKLLSRDSQLTAPQVSKLANKLS